MTIKQSKFLNFQLAAGLLAIILAAGSSAALAGISEGRAVTLCKAELKQAYGTDGRYSLHRIKKRGNYKVSMFVDGVSEERFKATCVIGKDGEIFALTPKLSEDKVVATH